MKQVMQLLLSGFFVLLAVNASAQTDSADLIKRQKELDRNETDIKNIQGKIDKKDRKMKRALRRAERKERKKEKHERRLRAAERKHHKLVTDTSHAYLFHQGNYSGGLRKQVSELFISISDNRMAIVADKPREPLQKT